jgi:CRP-like cAMP-binding protein
MYHLARLGRLRAVRRGDRLIEQGTSGDRLFIIVSGDMQAVIGGKEVGRIGRGEVAGEIALLDEEPRSADVIALTEGEVVEIMRGDLLRLMERRPRLGTAVMGNLATDLAEKLRKVDVRYAGSEERTK